MWVQKQSTNFCRDGENDTSLRLQWAQDNRTQNSLAGPEAKTSYKLGKLDLYPWRYSHRLQTYTSMNLNMLPIWTNHWFPGKMLQMLFAHHNWIIGMRLLSPSLLIAPCSSNASVGKCTLSYILQKAWEGILCLLNLTHISDELRQWQLLRQRIGDLKMKWHFKAKGQIPNYFCITLSNFCYYHKSCSVNSPFRWNLLASMRWHMGKI